MRRLHGGQHRLEAEERPGHVHVERPPPLGFLQLQQGRPGGVGRIVDQDVEPPEACQRVAYHTRHVFRPGHVARRRERPVAQLPRRLLGPLAIAHIHRHARAPSDQRPCGGTADPPPRARHQCHPPLQLPIHVGPLRTSAESPATHYLRPANDNGV